jgi:hypothetical protein
MIGGAMNETKVPYRTKAEVELVEHRCLNCDNVYGHETSDGYLKLRGSDVMVDNIETIRCRCAYCGNRLKFFSDDYRKQRQVKGRKK